MSTRAHIIVRKEGEPNHYVYHHHDGYLEGVGEDLKLFISCFSSCDKDIFDPEVFCKSLTLYDSAYEYENTGLHGDEEYIYNIKLVAPEYIEISATDIVEGKELSDFTTRYAIDKSQKIDSLTEILSGVISEFFKTPAGKQALQKSITEYFRI